jgi:archaeosine-15-forming tRNA-guanine transglycosylase
MAAAKMNRVAARQVSQFKRRQGGNSPQMIFEHYRELVTEKAAKAWFAITPEAAKALKAKLDQEREENIVKFPAKEAA